MPSSDYKSFYCKEAIAILSRSSTVVSVVGDVEGGVYDTGIPYQGLMGWKKKTLDFFSSVVSLQACEGKQQRGSQAGGLPGWFSVWQEKKKRGKKKTDS